MTIVIALMPGGFFLIIEDFGEISINQQIARPTTSIDHDEEKCSNNYFDLYRSASIS